MQSFKIFAEELARSSDKCIFTLNLSSTIESANEACSSWFGEGGPIQWSGKQVEELVADRDLLSMFNESRQSMAAGDSEFALERLVNRNESPERLTLSCRQICNRDGQAIGYGYSIETKAAADSDFERIMLRNLMKNCQDLIFFKDLDSRFTRVSDSMVERLGANSLEEVIGKSDFDFWDLASATKFFDAEQDIIRTQVPVSGKTETAVRTNGYKRKTN